MTSLGLTPDEIMPVAAALAAARDQGLLAELEAREASVQSLASALQLDVRAVGMVLELLAEFGLVERRGGVFALSSFTRAASRAVPGGFGAERRLWSRLASFLRDGLAVTDIDRGTSERAALYATVVDGLGDLWSAAAEHLATALSGHGPRVLDVGCGSGVWSLALARARPDVTVTGLDFPAVLTSFEARAAALGAAISVLPGDAHTIALEPAAFDVVLIANVLRLETPERASALVTRVADAVAPGGQLVVIDSLACDTHAAKRARAIYALHLGMRTRDGRVYAPAEVAAWLGAAGLVGVEAVDLGEAPGATAGLRAWRRA